VAGCESDPAPGSGFHDKIVRQSEVVGVVWNGADPAEGALVRIASARPSDYAPRSVVTIAGGKYRFVEAPPAYDLQARFERKVLTREGLLTRFFDPSFDGVGTPRAWTARLDATVGGARPGHSLRFFAVGEKTLTVSGDVASGLVVGFTEYTSKISLAAVEVPDGGDVTNAVASAKVELDVRAESRVPVHFALAPIERKATISFAMKGGAGFAPEPAAVRIDFGRFGGRTLIAEVPIGEAREVAVVPDAIYVVSLRAKAGGAEVDSGHVFFGFDRPVVEIPVPDAAPLLGTPAEGAFIDATSSLTVPEPGVVEHLLEPLAPDGIVLSLGSQSGSARLPDVTALGLPRVTGWYRWRVRRYPDLDFIDQLAGPFFRVAPSAWSAPRTIVLQ
jgi:hypothetical protein